MITATDQRLLELLQPPKRSVKPRSREFKYLPIVAVIGEQTLDENGEVGKTKDLIRLLPRYEPTMFTVINGAKFLGMLDDHYKARYKSWHWYVTPHHQEVVKISEGFKAVSREKMIVNYFGFKTEHQSRYHRMLDPVMFCGLRLDEVWPGDEPKIQRLVQWSVALREFCREQGWELRPTQGGTIRQCWTDRRFYPDARRRVPRATNDRARENLPGNHYYLTVRPDPHKDYCVHYYDQTRAHHYHAEHTRLPDSNDLWAYGRFADVAKCVISDTRADFMGLYCLDLRVPTDRTTSHWVRKWLHHKITERGKILERRYIYSNELPLLQDSGYTVCGVRAAWGSLTRDNGVSRYAKWAQSYLDNHQSEQGWLKPILLSAYGTLATRPRVTQGVRNTGDKGELVNLYASNYRLRGLLNVGRKPMEPRTANVLHRGMIEAATRCESIGYAQYLEHLGHRVMMIYADAVVIEECEDLPMPPEIDPWRRKRTLTHFQPIDLQSFVSDQMRKMPGRSRDFIPYQRHSTGKAPRLSQVLQVTGKLHAN